MLTETGKNYKKGAAALAALILALAWPKKAEAAEEEPGTGEEQPEEAGISVEFPEFKKARTVLFDQQLYKDTNYHYPPDHMMDLERARHWFVWVNNTTDQDLLIEWIANVQDVPAGSGNSGLTDTVPTGTKMPVFANLWAPYVGIRIKHSTAPSSGYVQVEGWIQYRTEGQAVAAGGSTGTSSGNGTGNGGENGGGGAPPPAAV